MEHSDTKENALLLEAFNAFSQASLTLEKSYSDLQAHTKELDLELQETNEKLEKALIEQEAASLHLKGVLNSLKTGIMVVDLEGVVLDINPCASKLLGIQAKKRHYSDLALPEPVREFIEACIEGTMPRVPREEVSIERQGEQLDLELSFTLVRPEGGGIMSVLFILNDLTLLNRLQTQSQRSARLAAMGEMAAELAHEIRNPLGSIKLFASLLEGDLAEDPDQAKLAHQILHGVGILENIVSNTLAFSANVTPKQEPIIVATLLEESLPLFELERNRKQIELIFQKPEASLQITGDTHLLKQVLLNLCNNAIKAMKPNGVLRISAKTREEFIELAITDTGCGIPAEKLPKIFDPFYTTFKGGTGLGLSVVNQIVEKHGGAINILSKVGQGTSVLVSLPRELG